MEIAQKRRERVTRAYLYYITYEKLCWISYIQIYILYKYIFIFLFKGCSVIVGLYGIYPCAASLQVFTGL